MRALTDALDANGLVSPAPSRFCSRAPPPIGNASPAARRWSERASRYASGRLTSARAARNPAGVKCCRLCLTSTSASTKHTCAPSRCFAARRFLRTSRWTRRLSSSICAGNCTEKSSMNSFRFRFRSPPTPEEEAQEARRRRADVETSRGNARWQISVEGRAGMDPRGDDGDAGTPPSDRARRVSSDPGEHARVGTTRPGTETRAEVRAVGGCKHRHRGGALPETGARANAALAPIAASRQDVGAATFAVVPEITHTKNAMQPQTCSRSCHVKVCRSRSEKIASEICLSRVFFCSSSSNFSDLLVGSICEPNTRRARSRDRLKAKKRSRDLLPNPTNRPTENLTSRARRRIARWRPFQVDSRWATGRRTRAPSPTPSRCTR